MEIMRANADGGGGQKALMKHYRYMQNLSWVIGLWTRLVLVAFEGAGT